MAPSNTQQAAAANASDPPPWYKSLTPEDKIAYWKARDDYNKAAADYQAAVAKAEADRQKTLQVHKDAMEAWRKANEAVIGETGAVVLANSRRRALADMAGGYDAKEVRTAADAKEQGDKLQELLEEYKKALAALVAARGEAEAKLQLLIAASQSPVTDPEEATIKEATRLQADAQYDMDVAKADIPREAAKDAFAVKETELRARIPKDRRPDALVSSVQAD